MNLISVGTMGYDFSRFLQIIDELCEENILNGNEIIAQIGENKYSPRNYKSFDFLSHDEYEVYMKDAEYLITHAGTGSVLPPLKMNKKIILFPRLAKYGEHLDDHQSELASLFANEGYTLEAKDKEELVVCISKIKDFYPREFISNTSNFNNLIISYIDFNFI